MTLETATALGLLSPEEDDLLARFLHPELEESLPPLGPPIRPTPLIFRLYEAIGEPLPTTNLPLAFAHADLDPSAGWKAQLEAAERLARAGAIAPNQLLGPYTERRPSASGGVWERARATQELDGALAAGDADRIAAALSDGWERFADSGLEVTFAGMFAARLDPALLSADARSRAFRLSLLTGDVLIAAARHAPADAEEAFLVSLAHGRPEEALADGPLAAAIAAGFGQTAMPVRFTSGTGMEGRGAALLRALAGFTSGTTGTYDDLRDGLALLRMLGFETAARRTALELLILVEPA